MLKDNVSSVPYIHELSIVTTLLEVQMHPCPVIIVDWVSVKLVYLTVIPTSFILICLTLAE